MRHKKKGRKLHRKRDQRRALIKILAANLILNEKIKTTEAKAKEVRPYLEKKITKAKTDSLANRRLLYRSFPPKVVKKLFVEIAPRYKDRNGGYIRITKLGHRERDSVPMVEIELV